MTNHNITGSEVGAEPAPVYLREIKTSRPINARVLLPFAAALALPAFLVDQLVGFPICVVVVLAAFFALLLKPETR
ncbi:MAG: hypothetical protein EOP20_00715 [Hyphomicrobiales bacterium]|nr:MAG: hypothetical protein EOP20_00715 [Hyphomicrobiales bacterium]